MAVAYIGLGANVPGPAGTPEQTLAAAAGRLAELGRIVARSSLYSTEPVGYADQPQFLNAVAALETHLSPRRLLTALLNLEREYGRDRAAGFVNGPRTLDLDILLFGDLVLSEHDLHVPHPRLAERGFVLAPLCEIAPEMRDPRGRNTVKQLLDTLVSDPQGSSHAVVQIKSNLWSSAVAGGNNPGSGGADAYPDHG